MSQTNDDIGKPQAEQNNSAHKCDLLECAREIWNRFKRGIYSILALFKFIDGITFFTGLLVIVAWLQYRALDNTDHTLKAQQRAWVQPLTPKVAALIREPATLVVQFFFRNVGKEPAINGVMQLPPVLLTVEPSRNWYELLPGPNPICELAAPNKDGITIFPDTAADGVQWPQLIPDPELVFDRKKILVVQGCIGYMTVDTPHYSAFCYYWEPTEQPPDQWVMRRCIKHNEAS